MQKYLLERFEEDFTETFNMQHYKINKVKLPGISKYLWEIQYRGLWKYYKTNYGYFTSSIDAVKRLVEENKGLSVIIKVDDGD